MAIPRSAKQLPRLFGARGLAKMSADWEVVLTYVTSMPLSCVRVSWILPMLTLCLRRTCPSLEGNPLAMTFITAWLSSRMIDRGPRRSSNRSRAGIASEDKVLQRQRLLFVELQKGFVCPLHTQGNVNHVFGPARTTQPLLVPREVSELPPKPESTRTKS